MFARLVWVVTYLCMLFKWGDSRHKKHQPDLPSINIKFGPLSPVWKTTGRDLSDNFIFVYIYIIYIKHQININLLNHHTASEYLFSFCRSIFAFVTKIHLVVHQTKALSHRENKNHGCLSDCLHGVSNRNDKDDPPSRQLHYVFFVVAVVVFWMSRPTKRLYSKSLAKKEHTPREGEYKKNNCTTFASFSTFHHQICMANPVSC